MLTTSDPTQGECKATSELDPNSRLRSDVFQGRWRATEWKRRSRPSKKGRKHKLKRREEKRLGFKKRLERNLDEKEEEVSQAKRNGSEWESGWLSNLLVPSKPRWMRMQV